MLRIAFLSHSPLPFPAVHATATLLTLLSLAAPALAAPVDPVVRNGVATFAVNGNVFTVTNSPGAIIDWRQFNLANGELMRFLQQNAQSIVLNRVTGNDPSQILGALQSNGRVLLVNPNGVLFGANASVDVAGLVVSGLRLSDADFLAGKYSFGGGNGAVANFGAITTPLGGSVYLIGADVANSGVIRAPGGQILLAAGHSVSLADSGAPNLSVTLSANGNQARNLGELSAAGGRIDIYGALVDQQGIVRADSSGVDAQGRIVLKASDQATLSGTLSAASADGAGGTVQVLGDKVTLSGSARIDASGALGGGTVLVGGDYQGKNPAVQNASTTTVAAGASIDASARERGDGGKVVVWSDGVTAYNGLVLARGGAQGGDGGLVETSGHTLRNGGKVDTRAPKGRTGNWLLDPGVYCFYSVSASECAGGADSTVDQIDNIENYLAMSNATLQATDYISFLPAGGAAAVDSDIPAGYTLSVLAPYISIGKGANIVTNAVALDLRASSIYGTTSITDSAGLNKTGAIDIAGRLSSNASQRVVASNGFLTIGDSSSSSSAGLFMVAAGGTQIVGGRGIQLLASATGDAGIVANGDNSTQLIAALGASSLTLKAGDAGDRNSAYITASGANVKQSVLVGGNIDLVAGKGGSSNIAQINAHGGDQPGSAVQEISGSTIRLYGGITNGLSQNVGNNATIETSGTQTISAGSVLLQAGANATALNDWGASHALFGADGNQTITVSGDLSLVGGSGAGSSRAFIYGYHNQTVTAKTVSLQAGDSGDSNNVGINIYYDNNRAPIADVTQSITADSLVLQGGAGGNNNQADLSSSNQAAQQIINVGTLSLIGGGGQSNRATLSVWGGSLENSPTTQQTIQAATINLVGGSGKGTQANIGGNAIQVISADDIVMRGGSGGDSGARISTRQAQTLTVKNNLSMTGGSSAMTDTWNGTSISTQDNQQIRAGALVLNGGTAGNNNGVDIVSNANQTIAAKSIVLNGGSGGNDSYASLGAYFSSNAPNLNRTQKIDADSITITGGAGTNNTAGIFGNGGGVTQLITAPSISMLGGAGGTENWARIAMYFDNSGKPTIQTIKTGALSLNGGHGSGNGASIDYTGGSTQTIQATSLMLTGGTAGANSSANIHSEGGQNITVENSIAMLGGSGNGTLNQQTGGGASIGSNGNQNIAATSLTLIGGSSGVNNNSHIGTDGNQTITVKDLLVQGGARGAGNSGNISLNNGAGHAQTITASSSMSLAGGAEGTSNYAGVHVNGAGATQLINTPNLTLSGGAGGNDNWAHLWASDGTPVAPRQTINAGAIKITGGGTDGNAMIGGNGNQFITADSVALRGGTGGEGNAGISTDGDQNLTVRGAITLVGGTADNTGTVYNTTWIHGASQNIAADSLTVKGGASGNQNTAHVDSKRGQIITLAGNLLIQGGANGTRNGASIDTGDRQTITAQSITVNGGAGGSRNYSFLYSGYGVGEGSQTINANTLTIAGGTGERNYSYVSAEGNQSINLSGILAVIGGTQTGTFAELTHGSDGDQTVSANKITLVSGSNTNSGGYLYNFGGAQTINLTGAKPELALTGGSGSGTYGSAAAIYHDGVGKQQININGGGSVVLRGGNGDGPGYTNSPGDYYCSGCKYSDNGAGILSFGGGGQTLDFTAGGTLDLFGGSNGSGNSAAILIDLSNGGQQTITSSGGAANYPTIRLTGGSGGYFNQADGAVQTNNAAIGSALQLTAATAGALKTINAKSITLNGGGSANTHGGALLGTGQGDAVINVTGDLIMTGGASSVPLLAATDPANAYSRDQGAIAAINPDGNLKLTVGGNLLMQGGSGASSGALIDANSAGGKVTLAVAGATRMLAGASSAAILSHTTTASTDPRGGAVVVDLGNDGAFTTSTFSSSGKSFRLKGTLTASGANANAPLLPIYSANSDAPDWKVLGAKDLQAGIYASDSYVSEGEIVTPNGNWLVALGKTAAADSASAITYSALTAHGYQWTPAAYDSGNAAEFRFILPGDAPVVDLRAADNIANATCVTNAAMCATPEVSNGVTMAAASAAVTYDVQLNVADGTPPSAPASSVPAAAEEGPAAGVATAQVGVSGKRAATREKEEAQAADDKKTTAELKREARVASSEAKADMAAVRKVELAAKKDAGAARAAAVAAAREEAQAKRAEATAQRADADLKLVAGDIAKAEAEVRGAATPVLKVAAQARKADVDARRAGLEARLADANAKKAEAGAKRSEALAKGADADALGLDAGARALAAEAKLAEAARSEALVQAREARSPQQRAAAERLAEDKRVDAAQKNAESRVRAALADDLRAAASQGKVQADARRAQAQAGLLEAQARREESQLQAATARSHQEEAAAQRAIAGGRPEAAKAAQARKAGLDRQVVAQARKADARQAAAAAKAEEARAKQAKADEAALQVAQRDDARRQRALQAFAATATAAMSGDQLAERAALRHAYKTEVFKEALNLLAQNKQAADLPVCAGGAVNVCVPAPVQLQAQLQAQAGQPGRPPLRLPSAAFLPQIERKVALVIGINHYRDQRITPLDSAVPDANAVAALMAERMGYEVRVLRDATKAEIVNGIAALSRELGPKDSVTVYYAGHGYMTGNAKSGQQGYWIPSDAASNNPANWISTNDVGRLLAAIPASQVMLVSDSCYSGTFAREQQVAAGADAGQILARRSVVVMSSGGEEPVADDGVDGHSIFAWSLMQALRQVDRYDTGARVFDATKAKVTAAYPQVPRYGAAMSAGHASGGDYLFEARSYK